MVVCKYYAAWNSLLVDMDLLDIFKEKSFRSVVFLQCSDTVVLPKLKAFGV